MAAQNYKNHHRYYIPHHFVFYPVIFAATVFCCISINRYPECKTEWMVITGIFLMLGWLSFMMRQHYALTNQNRTVRLEMRLRYYQLTQQRLEPMEEQLGFGRIAALRFASDDEMPTLLHRALKENLSSNDIKKSITNWQADNMRV